MSNWDDTEEWPPSSQRYYSEKPKEPEPVPYKPFDLTPGPRYVQKKAKLNDVTEEDESLAVKGRSAAPKREGSVMDSPRKQKPQSNAPKTPREQHLAFLAEPRVRDATVLNPNFLESFYANSRLHHLSTWRAELKSQFQAMASSRPARKMPHNIKRRYILHVDFDSFFAAVSLLSRPDLKGKPVCVCHGSETGSSNEVASVNYKAREFGVRNGMWMKQVKELCPDIVALPFDFPGYETASRGFYKVLLGVGSDRIQSVSVDEALLDVTSLCISTEDEPPSTQDQIQAEYLRVKQISQSIRDEVRARTNCDVSVGCGGNILLAKLALRKAKPGGQFHLKPDNVLNFLAPLKPEDLPGVGYSTAKKLAELEIRTVADIREASKEFLQKNCGEKTGDKLWEYARGIDTTELGNSEARKSVTADINWGVRFEDNAQVFEFLQRLSAELARRLEGIDLVGRHLTLKVMVRSKDAPIITPKFLGCGKCDTFNKSVDLPFATGNSDKVYQEVAVLMKQFDFPPEELRGIGLMMTKLESRLTGESAKQKVLGFKRKENIPPVGVEEGRGKRENISPVEPKEELRTASPTGNAEFETLKQDPADAEMDDGFPRESQIDMEVLNALPEDIRKEVLESLKRPNATTHPLTQHNQTSIIPKRNKKRQVRLPVMKLSGSNTPRERSDSPAPIQQWSTILGCKRPHSEISVPPQERDFGSGVTPPPKTARTKTPYNKNDIFEAWPPFQDHTNPSEILLLILEWHETRREMGPDWEDVKEWAAYLRKMARWRPVVARGVARWFAERVGSEGKWGETAGFVRGVVEEGCG